MARAPSSAARRVGTYTAPVLPVCDVVPRRTPARTTWCTLAALLAVAAWAWTQPALRPTAWLWLVDGWAVLLSAPAVEDRLASLRFVALLAAAAGVAVTVAMIVGGPGWWVMPSGVAASTLAGHLTLFRGSQVLALFVGWPYSVHELPMTSVALVWTTIRIGVWSLAPTGAVTATALVSPASIVSGALVGALLARLLQRRDRASPEWWDASPRPGTRHH